jgi:L-2-hydroxyglutarate oxidase
MKKYDVVVIGAGIVGLATALKIKQQKPQLRLCVIDKEKTLAAHQTGHNSGVIHSGIYYKPGSLKARNCKEGYRQLVQYAAEKNIAYELCGKVIVATKDAEIPALDVLYERGLANGLEGLRKLGRQELREIEPHVRGAQGVWVPQTGIIDFKAVSEAYAGDIKQLDGDIWLDNKLIALNGRDTETLLETLRGTIATRLVVNCAGLYSDKIARMTGSAPPVKIVPFRGEYYQLSKEKEHLVRNLIYPVPDPNFPFLGVHFTRMIHGGIEAGPNAVLAFAREGYKKNNINAAELAETLAWPGFMRVASKYWQTGLGEMHRSFSKKAFAKALQALIPDIQAADLTAGGAGVRAQACDRTGGLVDDFLIVENKMAVNVCNAPSPAATSSLAIGDHIAALALKRF